MKHKLIITVVLILAINLVGSICLFAGETKAMSAASDDVREVLTANLGKRISVKTDSGEALEGTVVKVGDTLVRLERLTGRDFYDAVVKIDRISSVVIRVRGN